MKRLFQVLDSSNTFVMFFDNKEEAKGLRDGMKGARVSLGPDHWRYGLKGNPRTHSHNSRSGGHGNGFPKRPLR